MDSRITSYTSVDREAVKKLIFDGLKEFGFTYTPSLDYDLDDIEKYYIKDGGMFSVLKLDNEIIGTVAVINKGLVGELKRLYIDRAYQGKGYGAKLLDYAIAFCKEKGMKKMEFETNKKFTKAHLLYQRRGFTIAREDKESYYMEKEL